MTLALLIALPLAALVIAAAWWTRAHPSPLPYNQRFMLDLPRPFISRDQVCTMLDPQLGEAILEVGPGTGHYTLPVAERLGSQGALHVFDVEPRYIDHTLCKAAEHGLDNVLATCGDATVLPFADDSFDAAFLVQVLGEVPDQNAALGELQRVLKPAGRLVVGENVLDPHVVSVRALRSRADAAGLQSDGVTGGAFGYVARFTCTGT